jgi:hypothetical protein
VEFVRVRVGFWLQFEALDHIGSVFKVGCRVKDLLWLGLLFFSFLLLGLFGCLFSFFYIQSLLLLDALLLIFAQLLALFFAFLSSLHYGLSLHFLLLLSFHLSFLLHVDDIQEIINLVSK